MPLLRLPTSPTLPRSRRSITGPAHFVVLVAMLLVAACGTNAGPTPTVTPRSDYKLGFITNAGGSIKDGTFNEISYNGAALAARDFGLDFAYREAVEDKDYTSLIEKMVADGRNIIVTVGFQMTDATLAAAQKYPKVYFIGVDLFLDNPPSNFQGVLFREDQGGFLAGALAGMMTKSNVVGVVGGLKIASVMGFVNGFVNGAKYVNPAVNVLSVYTSGFANVEEGRARAEEMVNQKADVIFGAGGLTGSSGIVHAAELGTYVIGVDQDEYRTTFAGGKTKDSNRILTSAIKRVDQGVYAAVSDILAGKWKGGLRVFGAAECGISYAPFHENDGTIPTDVKNKLEAVWRALAGGTLNTGASSADPSATPPPPLAAGAMPPVSDKAPKLSDCTRS